MAVRERESFIVKVDSLVLDMYIVEAENEAQAILAVRGKEYRDLTRMYPHRTSRGPNQKTVWAKPNDHEYDKNFTAPEGSECTKPKTSSSP